MIYETLFLIDYCFLTQLLALFAIYRDGQFLLVEELESKATAIYEFRNNNFSINGLCIQ